MMSFLRIYANRRNQTYYITVITKYIFFIIHWPRSDNTHNYNQYIAKL